jgi:hypothetical protein
MNKDESSISLHQYWCHVSNNATYPIRGRMPLEESLSISTGLATRPSQLAPKKSLVENMVKKNRSHFPIAVLLTTFLEVFWGA